MGRTHWFNEVFVYTCRAKESNRNHCNDIYIAIVIYLLTHFTITMIHTLFQVAANILLNFEVVTNRSGHVMLRGLCTGRTATLVCLL